LLKDVWGECNNKGEKMNVNVWMEIDTGGKNPAIVCESINHTLNAAPMWDLALSIAKNIMRSSG